MEELAANGNESFARALQTLQELHEKHPDNPMYSRLSEEFPRFLEKEVRKDLELLEARGVVKLGPYIPPSIVDPISSEYVPNIAKIPRPGVTQIDILEKGLPYLKSRTTVTRTKTVQETFQEPEEPAWKARQRTRDLVRTERGNQILTMCPEALQSDIRGHLAALRDPNGPRKALTVHKIWLSYELNWRWNDIPLELRHEMEDYRDLPVTRRKRF